MIAATPRMRFWKPKDTEPTAIDQRQVQASPPPQSLAVQTIRSSILPMNAPPVMALHGKALLLPQDVLRSAMRSAHTDCSDGSPSGPSRQAFDPPPLRKNYTEQTLVSAW
eukprot:154194-Chlamydomonas_euryale.AAC.1